MNEPAAIRPAPPEPTLPGRLNSFQKTMLDWNDLHAYNAVHVVKISRAPDLARLQQTLHDTLAFHRLSRLTLNRRQGTFQYDSLAARYEVKVIEARGDSSAALRAEIETQINTRFDIAGPFQPFRFFIICERESYQLGLVYFHAVADAVAVVQLLRHLHTALHDPSSSPPLEKIQLIQHRHRFNPLTLLRQTGRFLTNIRQQRRCMRVIHSNLANGRNRFEHLSLDTESLRGLTSTAKSWNVTINDLFLAVLLQCCAPFTSKLRNHPSRRHLAIGSIVNTRNDLSLAHPHGWGLLLGSFVITYKAPDEVGLRELSQAVRLQTLAIKQRKAYAGPPVELALGRWLLSFFATAYRPKIYQKHFPLWGGLTNMNVNSLWPQPVGAPPLEYFRGVSTGPVTPLVLSVTTAGAGLNLGLTFRASTFTDEQISEVKKLFRQTLEQANIRA